VVVVKRFSNEDNGYTGWSVDSLQLLASAPAAQTQGATSVLLLAERRTSITLQNFRDGKCVPFKSSMNMEAAEVVARLELLRQRDWPLDKISNWFGTALRGDGFRLVQQFQMWDKKNYGAAFDAHALIDRARLKSF
jgi:hypothetical protein